MGSRMNVTLQKKTTREYGHKSQYEALMDQPNVALIFLIRNGPISVKSAKNGYLKRRFVNLNRCKL